MTDTPTPQQLPLFEGRRPLDAGVKLTGRVTTPFRALHMGEQVILVARGQVVSIDHVDDDGHLTRVHKVKLSEAHELPGGQGDMALLEGQEWSRRIDDARTGWIPFDAQLDTDEP